MSPRIYESQQKKYCKHRNESKIEWCHENSLWTNSSRPRVALVSYPGSGNTWMRYLLQQSTGILTGSVFPDPSLKKSGFGEGINNQSVIVVKTHNIGITRNKGKFDRAVLLVRDPFDAILAQFNWIQSKSHIGHATEDKFHGKGWSSFAKNWVPGCSSFECFAKKEVKRWTELNMSCLNLFKKKQQHFIAISYEDLIQNPEKELSKVLQFLDIKISDESMRCTIDCKEGIHHRSKNKTVNFPIYSPEVAEVIKSEKVTVYQKLGLPYPQSAEEILKKIDANGQTGRTPE